MGRQDKIELQIIYNLELELKRYGEEIIEDTAAFALKVLKNALKQKQK